MMMVMGLWPFNMFQHTTSPSTLLLWCCGLCSPVLQSIPLVFHNGFIKGLPFCCRHPITDGGVPCVCVNHINLIGRLGPSHDNPYALHDVMAWVIVMHWAVAFYFGTHSHSRTSKTLCIWIYMLHVCCGWAGGHLWFRGVNLLVFHFNCTLYNVIFKGICFWESAFFSFLPAY